MDIKKDMEKYDHIFFKYYIINNINIIENGIEFFTKELSDKTKKDYHYLFYFYIGFYYIFIDKKKSIFNLKESIKLNNIFFNPYRFLGEVYSLQNKYKYALKYYKKSLILYNKYNHNYVDIDDFKSTKYRFYSLKSDVYVYIKPNFNKAINYLDKAKEYINFWDTEYFFYNKIGILYDKFNKYDDAIKNYEYAIKSISEGLNKNSYIVYRNISISYAKKNDYLNAIKYMDLYINKDKDLTVENYYYKAFYEGMNNNIDEAYNCFKNGLEFNRRSTKNLMDMALMLVKEGKKFDIKSLMENVIYNDFDNKENLDDNVDDNILYKYRYIDINSLKLLLNGNLRLSDYNYFNDPADPPMKLNMQAFDYIKEHIKSIKICSLSKNKQSILMWSHYADEHKGICIAYDMSSLRNDNLKLSYLLLKKVKYINKITFASNDSLISKYDNSENFSNNNHIINISNKYITRFIDLFYLKYKDWKYEYEYRIIADTEEKYIYLPIKAIYFGMNAEDENIALIASILKSKYGTRIPLYKMKPKESNLYNLDYTDISREFY